MSMYYAILIISCGAPFVTGYISTIHVKGAGASFPTDVYKIWMTEYRAYRRDNILVSMEYDARGSSYGKKMIKDPMLPVEYAGSDSFLKEVEYVSTPDLQMFPSLAGAVVMGFNIPGVNQLNLSREHLVGIYNGTFTRWNDVSIQALNPENKLPDAKIIAMARADKSGTTDIFTRSLSRFDSNWQKTMGHFSYGLDENYNPLKWNSSVLTFYGRTTRGITGLLLSIHYSISYLSMAQAINAKLTYANIQNKAGVILEPTTETVQSAMKNNDFSARFNVDITDSSDHRAYPMVAYTYLIIRLQTMRNCDKAVELYTYINWFLTNNNAKLGAIHQNMIPLSNEVTTLVLKTLERWFCNDVSVSVTAKEMRRLELIIPMELWKIIMIAVISIIVIIFIALATYLVYQHVKVNMAIYKHEWKICLDDGDDVSGRRTPGSKFSASVTPVDDNINSTASYVKTNLVKTAMYHDQQVSIWCLTISPSSVFSFKTQKMLLEFRDSIIHQNVSHFYGLSVSDAYLYSVSEYCSKGTLKSIVQSSDYKLDDNFKFSLACDVAAGMAFLHRIGIIHGSLSSAVCFIDSRWNVKIAHWMDKTIGELQKDRRLGSEYVKKCNESLIQRLCVPPELLQDDRLNFTKSMDMYGFSFLLGEIFMRVHPYGNYQGSEDQQHIIKKILNENMRPKLVNIPERLSDLIKQAWSNDPSMRPTFSNTQKVLERIKPSRKSVLDCMMEAVDGYIATLEDKVGERTAELASAKANMENLLYKMLPSVVAKKLASGENIDPETFESVTIFFSDIVGFTSLSSDSTPMEIVAMLNDLYTEFDNVIDQHDVYKVETIGDAYMVISGAPQRNGIAHASHISLMAMDLANLSSRFVIRHRKNTKLKLRVGIHSGSTVAGVVGLKMPRYCLFGDTVNTASRMETTCVPMKIQLSEYTRQLLERLGGFELQRRGKVTVKGKGDMMTYWLQGHTTITLPHEFTRIIEETEMP